jgi:aspartyl-tRNA(Asn)/glutamyl-tRNA(Gln) amidotransferase subunit A
MSGTDLVFRSLSEVAALLASRRLSPVELLEAVLVQTRAFEPTVHAYITPTFERAEAAARVAEQEIIDGAYRGPLHGIPIAVKDNLWTRGLRTTAGSKLLEDFVPQEDAATVARLLAAGAVLTGKCNMHELASGGTTTNAYFGATHNPWSLDRIPGGSSGGSAAAVAAGFCYAALGTDTAGSVRNPAAYCGLVGLKGTYGRVSNYGVVPLSYTADHVGPLARTVRDTALTMQAISGFDRRDPTSVKVPVPELLAGFGGDLKGLRVGLPRRYFFDQIAADVDSAVEAALGVLLDLGASIQDVDFPAAGMTPLLYRFITRPEAASFQEEFLQLRPQDYGDAAIRNMANLGEFVLAKDYLRAQRLRAAMRVELEQIMDDVDLLVTPTTPTVAHPIGRPFTQVDGAPIEPFDLTVGLTAPFDLTGSPAISLPCGFTEDDLPVGLQLVGRAWDEATVLRAADAFERATDWHERHPGL